MSMYSASKPSGFKQRPTVDDKYQDLVVENEKLTRRIEDLEKVVKNLTQQQSTLVNHKKATERAFKAMAESNEKSVVNLSNEIKNIKSTLRLD